jgi:hypothetical protein
VEHNEQFKPDYHSTMPESTDFNPFAQLGLEPVYRIDSAQIERAYRIGLAQSHPDMGAGGGGADPAALNAARATLSDHEQRASALLAVLGGPDASSCRDLPDGFLMDMMMQRQEIEEAIESGGEQERARWEQWGIEQRRAYHKEIAQRFEALSDPADHAGLRDIRVQLNAWRYIERLIEQLDPEYDPADADFQ